MCQRCSLCFDLHSRFLLCTSCGLGLGSFCDMLPPVFCPEVAYILMLAAHVDPKHVFMLMSSVLEASFVTLGMECGSKTHIYSLLSQFCSAFPEQ